MKLQKVVKPLRAGVSVWTKYGVLCPNCMSDHRPLPGVEERQDGGEMDTS